MEKENKTNCKPFKEYFGEENKGCGKIDINVIAVDSLSGELWLNCGDFKDGLNSTSGIELCSDCESKENKKGCGRKGFICGKGCLKCGKYDILLDEIPYCPDCMEKAEDKTGTTITSAEPVTDESVEKMFENKTLKIEIPKPICKTCKRLIETGKPFCYECMKCDICSPDCFEKENKTLEVRITDFNRHMSKEERDYYGEEFDDER